MAAKPHFAASVQSKKGRLYAVMQVKKDGTTKPVWRALGLPEGANKTKVNKAFREVVAQYRHICRSHRIYQIDDSLLWHILYPQKSILL